ncbi:MAG: helix-turn-helix transcriptional regulator [Propionibacteriaceae bacterium]|nr:helix-turn-helix transcriptional regulator [Propionibacteriaceae bacterium]
MALLSDGLSVNLVGMRASGRSRLLAATRERMGQLGYNVVYLVGVPAFKDRGLSALTTSGLDVGPNQNSVAHAVAALLRSMQSRSSVLIADDFDYVDPVSAGAIAAAHARSRFPVLFATRQSGDLAAPTRPAVQPCVRLELGPLRFDELHTLLHELLPDVVDSTTVARIATLSGGLPGLVRAIVAIGCRTGKIRREGGQWRGDGDLWMPQLASLVEPMLADLDAPQLTALRQLSMVGTITLEAARELVPIDVISQLDEAGLVQLAKTSLGPVVGVFPPLIPEYLRHESKPSRLYAAQDFVARHSPRFARTIQELADNYEYPGSGSSVMSQHVSEHWQAEESSLRAAWEADRSPAKAIALLTAMHASSADAEAVANVIANTDTRSAGPAEQANLASWHSLYLALEQDDLDAALDGLGAAASRLPGCRAALRAQAEHLRFCRDRVPDLDGLDALRSDGGDDPDCVVDFVRAESLAALGRTRDALAVLEAGTPADPLRRAQWLGLKSLAMVLDGDTDGGAALARHQLLRGDYALEPGIISVYAYTAALGLAVSGRFDELDAFTATMLTFTEETTFHRDYQLGTMVVAALAAAWRGRDDYAATLSAQAKALGRHIGPFPAMAPQTAPELVREPGDGEPLWRVVDELLARGYVAAAIAQAAAAVERRPDPVRAAALAERLDSVQSPMLRALGQYAVAACGENVVRLEEISRRLKETGAVVQAVRAGVRLALGLRELGDYDSATRAADEAWATMDSAPCQALFRPLVEAVDLSAREREIANLATAGLATSEMAHTLDLSVRTVENHISNMYRKIGVGSRARLREAMSTWLAQA